MIFYNPSPDYISVDMWAIPKDNKWYVYHLQSIHPNAQNTPRVGIGYCTSPDLYDFTYQGEAIPYDAPWEAGMYAGDVIERGGKYYMLYSGCSPEHADWVSLAISDDLIHWENYPGNPVMRYPDARWYEGTNTDTITSMNNLRDIHFINDVCDDKYVYICFAAATGDADEYRSACIGLARSQDMINWEYMPPLLSPKKYTLMEVPRVFQCGDKYFLTWLTAPWYGLRTDSDLGTRSQSCGETTLHYAVSLSAVYLQRKYCLYGRCSYLCSVPDSALYACRCPDAAPA